MPQTRDLRIQHELKPSVEANNSPRARQHKPSVTLQLLSLALFLVVSTSMTFINKATLILLPLPMVLMAFQMILGVCILGFINSCEFACHYLIVS